MAEFTKVMRWFEKMHERNRLLPDCGDCALGNGPISKCRKMLQEHPEECARVIEQYAAEHLEPRYPTWREWQQRISRMLSVLCIPARSWTRSTQTVMLMMSVTNAAISPSPPRSPKSWGLSPNRR